MPPPTLEDMNSFDTLANDINRKRRQYFIDLKAPMKAALENLATTKSAIGIIIGLTRIILMARKFPTPTRENIRKLNSKALYDIWEEYLEYENIPSLKFISEGLRRVVIGLNEHSSNYTERISWFGKKVHEKFEGGELKPNHPWTPTNGWSEPCVVKAQREKKEKLLKTIEKYI